MPQAPTRGSPSQPTARSDRASGDSRGRRPGLLAKPIESSLVIYCIRVVSTVPDSLARAGHPAPGKLPDLRSEPCAALRRRAAPIELPRVVMRGALAVALSGLLLALLLGLWRARDDMRHELDGAVRLADAMALLAERTGGAPRSRDELLAALQALQAGGGLRHLHLQLRDTEGRALLQSAVEPEPHAALAWLLALNRRVFPPPAPEAVSWPLARPGGEVWQLQLQASPEAEQREALERLIELLGLLAVGSVVMLAVMYWNVRRSFKPLRPLLGAIARIERQELAPLRDLPAMPIGELDAIARALRHLAGALGEAEDARRHLSGQLLTLQEDERSRLARELHDELGQHLTALRVDAAWLQRRLAGQAELATVAAGMGAQCERVQHEVRALLTRLRPLDALDAAHSTQGHQGGESVARLQALLQTLVHAWTKSPGQATRYALVFDDDGIEADATLPRALVLAVYRISQEALTNVARHAHASEARLQVCVRRVGDGGELQWTVQDDGRGLDDAAAWQRGNGLAGLKERIWAAGGDLEWGAADAWPERATPGLRLHARLPFAVVAG